MLVMISCEWDAVPDWWREPGVRRSASGSDKTADCFSSPDYSNLDVQKGLAWQAGGCCSVCGGDDDQVFFSLHFLEVSK